MRLPGRDLACRAPQAPLHSRTCCGAPSRSRTRSGRTARLRLGFGACAGEPAAWVFVAVQRLEAAPSPMDLVWGASTDTNGVPLNPKWGQQVNEPGSVPNAAECFSVPGYFDNPLCSIAAETPIAGHANWYPEHLRGADLLGLAGLLRPRLQHAAGAPHAERPERPHLPQRAEHQGRVRLTRDDRSLLHSVVGGLPRDPRRAQEGHGRRQGRDHLGADRDRLPARLPERAAPGVGPGDSRARRPPERRLGRVHAQLGQRRLLQPPGRAIASPSRCRGGRARRRCESTAARRSRATWAGSRASCGTCRASRSG